MKISLRGRSARGVGRTDRLVAATELYERGESDWARGKLRSAFQSFLAAAHAGVIPAFGLLAYFYDDGVGVKSDKDAALHWYRRAYRHGSPLAANNIGVIWRDRGHQRRALAWFRRAIALGDGDANLNVAKIYLDLDRRGDAARVLRGARKAKAVTPGTIEEARDLLGRAASAAKTAKRPRSSLEKRRSMKRGTC